MADMSNTLSVHIGGTGNMGMYMAPDLAGSGMHVWLTGRDGSKPARIGDWPEGTTVEQAVQETGARFVQLDLSDAAQAARFAGDVGNFVDKHKLNHVFWHYWPAGHELDHISVDELTEWRQAQDEDGAMFPSRREVQDMIGADKLNLVWDLNVRHPNRLLSELHRVPCEQTFVYMSSQAASPKFWRMGNEEYGRGKNEIELRLPHVPDITPVAIRAPFFEGADGLFKRFQALGDFPGMTWENVRLPLGDVATPIGELVYDKNAERFDQVEGRPHVYALRVSE